MKHIFTTLLISFSIVGFAQNQSKQLNANNILTQISSDGTMYNDNNQNGAFIAPYVGEESSASTVFTGNLWVAGIDEFGNINASVGAYNNTSYTYGMLDQSNGLPYEEEIMNQDRVWKITRSSIIKLVLDAAVGSVSQEIDKDILEWPAKGNPYYGDLFVDKDGAPFFDKNDDGIYNPYNGDYPLVGDDLQGFVPDELLLSVSNDSKVDNFLSLGIERYTMVYAVYCDEIEEINNSIFQRDIIYNRSDLNYYDVRIGHFFDPDLGCSEDDYVGCDSLNNVFYIYNSDETDGDAGSICTTGAKSFEKTPVHIAKVLNGELSSFNQYGRADLTPDTIPPSPTEIITESNVYNFCNGLWADGTPMTVGGSGYNLDNVDKTNYAFHGNPNVAESWSMYNQELVYTDPRIVAGRKFETLLSGDKLTIDLVHTFVQSDSLNHIQTVDYAIETANKVEDVFNNNFTEQCTQLSSCMSLSCVAPGDVNNNEIVERQDFMLLGLAIQKEQGFQLPRPFISTQWRLHHEELRTEYFKEGSNYIHADCNGDGLINSGDYDAINQHFDRKTEYFEDYTESCEAYFGEGNITFNGLPESVLSNNGMVVAGSSIWFKGFKGLSSLSFRIKYDSQLIIPFTSLQNIVTSVVSSTSGNSLIVSEDVGQGLVIINFDQSNIEEIDSVKLNLLFRFTGEGNQSSTSINIEEILMMDYEENFYCMDDVVYDIDFSDISTTKDIQNHNITLSPNPTQNSIRIESDTALDSYRLLDLNGKEIQVGKVADNQTIQFDGVSAGLYLLALQMPDELVHYERVVITD